MARRKQCHVHGMQTAPCSICAEIAALTQRAETAEALLAWAQESRLRWRSDSKSLRNSLQRGFIPRHALPYEEIPDALITTEERRAMAVAEKQAELDTAYAACRSHHESEEWRESMDDLCGIDRGALTSFDTMRAAEQRAAAARAETETIQRLRSELAALRGAHA